MKSSTGAGRRMRLASPEGTKEGRKEASSKPKCAEFPEDKVWTAKEEPNFQRDLKEIRKL